MSEWKLPETYVFEGRTVRYGVCGMGPPVVVVHGTPWSSFNLRFLIEALSESFTVYYYDLIGYGQSDKAPGDVSLGIQNQVLDMILRPWTEPGGKAAFYRQIAQANSGYTDEVQSLYAKIARPVLILWGREDTWIPLEQGEVLHGMIPGALFHVIPDSGHLVIEEQPGQLIEKIRPFLLVRIGREKSNIRYDYVKG